MEIYGIKNQVTFSWAHLKKSRDSYIKRLNDIYLDLLKTTTYVKGFAEFVDNKTVVVDG